MALSAACVMAAVMEASYESRGIVGGVLWLYFLYLCNFEEALD